MKLNLSFKCGRGHTGQTRLTTEFAQLLAHIDNAKLKSKCIQEFQIGNLDSNTALLPRYSFCPGRALINA